MGTKEILIADDHNLILEGFIKLLQHAPGVNHIDAFTDGTSVCEAVKKKQYDSYIIDLKIPDIDGFELIRKIKKRHSDARIIVCTMSEEMWIVNRLLRADIHGIVSKSSSVDHIEEALTTVLSGERYYCPRFMHLKKKYDAYRKKVGNKTMNLTLREQEVLGYIIEGMTTREIAEKIGVSDNGIEGFRKNLMEKTGSRNVAQLVAFAYENNLVKRK